MARARNIKPGFFTNDELALCAPCARLLFAGLWTIADREGRLEDRPIRIKAHVMPYDECDVDALLNELAGRNFIIRYENGGSKYIQITNFRKHQNPHVKEPASTIPAPGQNGTGPADSLLLIPSSTSSSPSPDVPEPDLAAEAVEELVSIGATAAGARSAINVAVLGKVPMGHVRAIIEFWKKNRGWGLGALLQRIESATPRGDPTMGWPQQYGVAGVKSAAQLAEERHYAAMQVLERMRGKSDEEKTEALKAAGYDWSDLK